MIANSAVPAVTTCRICGREGVATVDVFGDEGRQRQLLNKIRYCFSKQVRKRRNGGNRAINSARSCNCIGGAVDGAGQPIVNFVID